MRERYGIITAISVLGFLPKPVFFLHLAAQAAAGPALGAVLPPSADFACSLSFAVPAT